MEPNKYKTFNVGGIEVYPFPSREALADYAMAHKGILASVNAEITVNATPRLREIMNSNIAFCDGDGAVKALRRGGISEATRIPGCELWLYLIGRFCRTHSFYFIGTRREVIEGMVEKLRKEFPGINIAGFHSGFFTGDDDRNALIEDVVRTRPDFVFVAMGSPLQEFMMNDIQQRHRAVFLGLGGSFDLYMGLFRRAPRTIRNLGGEWLWRFVAQPSRLPRIVPYIKFAWRLYTNKL